MAIANYKAYLDGYDLIGTTQHDAPTINAITTELKGAAIGGTVEMPVKGLVQAMSMTLNWRTVTAQYPKILIQKAHHIELWAAVQETNPQTGELIIKQHKIIYRATPKNTTVGKFVPGETQDRATEFAVSYYRETYDGKDIIEIDPLNCIYKVGGEDVVSSIRQAIGLD